MQSNSTRLLTDALLKEVSEFQKENKLPNFGNKLSDYEVVGQLGRGSTAYVYKVKPRNQEALTTSALLQQGLDSFALKVIDKEEIKKKNLHRRVKNEIEINMHLARSQLQLEAMAARSGVD